MINHLHLILLCFLISACTNTELVEIKNSEGKLLEKFYQKKDGTVHGIRTSYHLNGKTATTENYIEGILTGERIIYFETGEVEIVENYSNNILDGNYKSYFQDGILEQEANYVDGKMEGVVKSFFKDGNLKEEVHFKDNEENGPFKEYHPNGKISWEGQYINGDNEIGIIIQYNNKDQMIKKMECDTFMNFSKCKTIWELKTDDNTKAI